MSKIKINQIESLTTDGDLSITPNGTGVMEIAGEDDNGTLQLNTATQSNKVKIKGPSTAENYTMILPTTDIDLSTNKILKVDSITGSGSTAVGQLAYTDLPAEDGNNLNASNITSGTLASARIPSPLPATTGAGFKLISTTTLSSQVTQIDFTLDDDSLYKMIGEFRFGYTSNGTANTASGVYLKLFNGSGSGYQQEVVSTGYNADFITSGGTYAQNFNTTSGQTLYSYTKALTQAAGSVGHFLAEFSTGGKNAWLFLKHRDQATSGYYEYNFHEQKASINNSQSNTKKFTYLRLETDNPSNYAFIANTKLYLYKYIEA